MAPSLFWMFLLVPSICTQNVYSANIVNYFFQDPTLFPLETETEVSTNHNSPQGNFGWLHNIVKLLQNEKPQISLSEESGKIIATVYPNNRKSSNTHVGKLLSFLSDRISLNKASIFIALKASVMATFGLYMLRRISMWYQSRADYEILLDYTDYSYQSYGCTITGEGALLLSSINKKIEKQNDFESIFHRLSILLDAPCFPQSLKEYSLLISKEVDVIINDMNTIIQNYNNTIFSANTTKLHSDFINFKSRNNISNHFSTYPSLISQLQNGITLLQSRQADAQLRIIRQDLLVAALECQEALSYWKKKVSSRTQVLRIPFPKYLALRFARIGRRVQIGMIDRMLTLNNFFSKTATKSSGRKPTSSTPSVTSTSSTYASYRNKLKLSLNKSDDDLLHYSSSTNSNTTGNSSQSSSTNSIHTLNSLNSIEKVIFLEVVLKGLYQAIGMVQSHLEDLMRLRIRLEQYQRYTQSHSPINITTSLTDNGHPSATTPMENNIKHEYQLNSSEWSELRQWIDQSVTVSATCLQALQLGCPPENPSTTPSPCSGMTTTPPALTAASTTFINTRSPSLTGFPRYTAGQLPTTITIASNNSIQYNLTNKINISNKGKPRNRNKEKGNTDNIHMDNDSIISERRMRGGNIDIKLTSDSYLNNITLSQNNISIDNVDDTIDNNTSYTSTSISSELFPTLISQNNNEMNTSLLSIESVQYHNTGPKLTVPPPPLLPITSILTTTLPSHSLINLLQSRLLLPPFDIYETVIRNTGDIITGNSPWKLCDHRIEIEERENASSSSIKTVDKSYSNHPIYRDIINKLNKIINPESNEIVSENNMTTISESNYHSIMELINNIMKQTSFSDSDSNSDSSICWMRTLNYTHFRKNAFMGPKSCPVETIQVLIVKPVSVLVESLREEKDVWESLTLVTYTNISSNQFCEGCSYYTICKFTQDSSTTTTIFDTASATTTSTNEEIERITDSKNYIKMEVGLHTVCPQSRFRGFIEFGIVNAIKPFFQKYLNILTTRLAVVDEKEKTNERYEQQQQQQQQLKSYKQEVLIKDNYDSSILIDNNTSTKFMNKNKNNNINATELLSVVMDGNNNNDDNIADSNTNNNINDISDKTKIDLKGGYSTFASLAEGLFKSTPKSDNTTTTLTTLTKIINESTVSTLVKLKQQQQHLQINSCKLSELLTSHDCLNGHFTTRLYQLGLQPNVRSYNYRNSRMAFTTLLLRRSVSSALRALLWVMLWRGSREIAMRWREIVEASETLKSNAGNVITRRIVEPVSTIISDLLFNKKPALADKAALKDAQRSLIVMLSDFLERSDKESGSSGSSRFFFPFSRSKPKFTKEEKQRILEQLDMSPVSREFEILTRRSLPKLVSGEMIRLILLQLQFLKKEMLMAMNALDDLLGANQVTLQLLACIPAVIILRVARSTILGFWDIIRSPYRVRLRTSRSVVRVLVKDGLRDISRQIDSLLMKELHMIDNRDYNSDVNFYSDDDGSTTSSTSTLLNANQTNREDLSYNTISDSRRTRSEIMNENNVMLDKVKELKFSNNIPSYNSNTNGRSRNRKEKMEEDYGKLLSALYQLQRLLVLHRTKFNLRALSNLQEDLRDIANARLGPRQSAVILSRINNNVEELFSS